MTDIVEELRKLAAVDGCQASIEAADEIERLRCIPPTPTRALMRQLFETQDTTLTLDIGCFGDGADDSVSVGPNPGFSKHTFVMSFASGSNQHGFTPDDAAHVRQLIQALLGWLDFVESGCVQPNRETIRARGGEE